MARTHMISFLYASYLNPLILKATLFIHMLCARLLRARNGRYGGLHRLYMTVAAAVKRGGKITYNQKFHLLSNY